MGPMRRKYLALLNSGYSYAEIAQLCGVSRQNVYASVRRYKRKVKPSDEPKRSYITGIENQVVYKGLAEYMVRNELNIPALAKMCNVSSGTLYHVLSGNQKLKDKHMDMIVEATGCSYEQLFAEVCV